MAVYVFVCLFLMWVCVLRLRLLLAAGRPVAVHLLQHDAAQPHPLQEQGGAPYRH